MEILIISIKHKCLYPKLSENICNNIKKSHILDLRAKSYWRLKLIEIFPWKTSTKQMNISCEICRNS